MHLENEPRFELINMDLNDAHSMRDVIIDIQPDYFINFAAQSFVAGSWDYPIQTWDTDARGSPYTRINQKVRTSLPLL